jgi:hypothetical protein
MMMMMMMIFDMSIDNYVKKMQDLWQRKDEDVELKV